MTEIAVMPPTPTLVAVAQSGAVMGCPLRLGWLHLVLGRDLAAEIASVDHVGGELDNLIPDSGQDAASRSGLYPVNRVDGIDALFGSPFILKPILAALMAPLVRLVEAPHRNRPRIAGDFHRSPPPLTRWLTSPRGDQHDQHNRQRGGEDVPFI